MWASVYSVTNECRFVVPYAETHVFHQGETVQLPCSTQCRTSPDWDYRAKETDEKKPVYDNGHIVENSSRYSVNCHLVIRNARADDEGIYVCSEHSGIGRTAATHYLRFAGTILLCNVHLCIYSFPV